MDSSFDILDKVRKFSSHSVTTTYDRAVNVKQASLWFLDVIKNEAC